MEETWRARKQQIVRGAIYDTAIRLFAAHGFEETTIEEIAAAAGVSRRSFFRYFASKDDLLAHSVVEYGQVLADAIRNGDADLSPHELIEKIVLAGAAYTSSQQHTRQIISIAEGSAAARQAHQSRLALVETLLAKAFAKRLKSSANDMTPRLLSGITLTVMKAGIVSWYQGKEEDLCHATRQVLQNLQQVLCTTRKVVPATRRPSSYHSARSNHRS